MLLKFEGFATSGANTTVVENGISCGECCVFEDLRLFFLCCHIVASVVY